jgi:hypothetical protein
LFLFFLLLSCVLCFCVCMLLAASNSETPQNWTPFHLTFCLV